MAYASHLLRFRDLIVLSCSHKSERFHYVEEFKLLNVAVDISDGLVDIKIVSKSQKGITTPISSATSSLS